MGQVVVPAKSCESSSSKGGERYANDLPTRLVLSWLSFWERTC